MPYVSNLRNKDLIVKIFFVLFVLFISYQLSVLSVNIYSKTHFTLISFLFVALLSYLFWKQAISLLIVWVIFAGVFRKWILPDLSETLFLFNYVILIGIYIRFFGRQLARQEPITIKHPINIVIGFQLLWSIICVLNPQLPNPLVGILGLVIHFIYIPMIYIIPKVINTKEKLLKLFKIFVLISIPVMILGVIQFLSPINHPINKYVSEVSGQGIAVVSNYPRVTSTFSYLSGYATYLSILIFVIVYLLNLKENKTSYNVFLLILLSFAIMNLLTTGSRGPAIITLVCVIGYFFLSGIGNLDFFKRSFLKLAFGVLIIFALLGFTGLGKNIYEAFMSRLTSSEDIIPRLIDTYTTPFKFAPIAGVYGFGIGSTYQGSEVIGNNLNRLQILTGGYEEEPERIVVEMGIFGFVLAYFIRLLFIIFFFNLYQKLTDPDLKSLALLSALFQIQFLGLQSLFFNSSSLIFYWFILSFIFLLPSFEKQSKEIETEPVTNKIFYKSRNLWKFSKSRF